MNPTELDEVYELIEEGPASTVARTWTALEEDGEAQWVVVKTATTNRKFAKEPHDIVKELRVLCGISHINIIEVLGHSRDVPSSTISIWMTYVSISLSQLLASPLFSPHPHPLRHSERPEGLLNRFTKLAQSIAYQTLSALAYLHNDARKIAHRDIKPNNILLTLDGCVKLIDFGIVWTESGSEFNRELNVPDNVWPEQREKMYFEVSTGPYRAPELLFGTRSYDPFAIDLWSFGATLAEFFTPLRLLPSVELDDDGGGGGISDTEEPQLPKPFIVPRNLNLDPDARWVRDTLFNSSRGEIGLAWSIFRVRGTPTPDIWPEFDSLPDAKGVQFMVVPPVALAPLLPHIPDNPGQGNTVDHFSGDEMEGSALDLVSRLLVYPSSRRLKAVDALSHPWFGADILLPETYPFEGKPTLIEQKSLGLWIQSVLSHTNE